MEIWKDINNYEGLYKISNIGRVLSLNFGPKNHSSSLGKPKILKTQRSSSGYLHVQLYKDGVAATKLVHKLVAETFIENPNSKPEVNHIDGDKSNNSVSNLEWVTKSENLKHAANIGLRISPMLGRFGRNNPRSKPILQYNLSGEFIRKWDSTSDAARYYGTRETNISACVNGRNRSSTGYIWKKYDGVNIPNYIDPLRVV